ncbi:hypothetical protein EIZ89_23365, partial [Escherichia coli]|nr:hypothetical protein [Escherichia coli]
KSAQIREILISESTWEEMTCLFAPSLDKHINTSATDTDQIQAFIVSTWMAPFQNDMYSEDNPISPYYKIEW